MYYNLLKTTLCYFPYLHGKLIKQFTKYKNVRILIKYRLERRRKTTLHVNLTVNDEAIVKKNIFIIEKRVGKQINLITDFQI